VHLEWRGGAFTQFAKKRANFQGAELREIDLLHVVCRLQGRQGINDIGRSIPVYGNRRMRKRQHNTTRRAQHLSKTILLFTGNPALYNSHYVDKECFPAFAILA